LAFADIYDKERQSDVVALPAQILAQGTQPGHYENEKGAKDVNEVIR
jgi:hypothetical protein